MTYYRREFTHPQAYDIPPGSARGGDCVWIEVPGRV